MRTRLALAAALSMLVAGCGGDSTEAPPPPPPPAGPPASIAIKSGDAQEAPAGTAVPVRPSVIVKDASGHAVSGVQVTFTVTGGGGIVTSSTATTGSDGIVSSGDWTLGPDEGPNTLSATVAGVTPVVFHATGKAAPRVVADTTLGPEGGTITVTDPGRPADGVRLAIPVGSYHTATPITISTLPPITLTLPQGVTQVGPLLGIAGLPAAEADSLLRLRIPITAPAGMAVAAFLRHPTTGRLELLTPVGRDDGSLTVATRHLSAALMLGSGPLGVSSIHAAAEPTTVQIVLLEALTSRLNQGIDTQFRPGIDDWEFTNYGSYLAPGGHCAGQSITAMWYFLRMKATRGPLNHSLDRLPSFEPDNPDGYRFASVVQDALDWDSQGLYFRALNVTTTVAGLSPDALHFQTLALAMLATGEPQYVAVHAPDAGHALVAWRVEANRVLVADPNFPGLERHIDFTGGAFQPYPSRPKADEADRLYPLIRTAGTTTMVATERVDQLWPNVLNHTIGAGQFPDYQLQYFDLLADEWKPLDASLTVRQDDLRVRIVCPTCASGISGSFSPSYIEWVLGYDGTGQEIGNGGTPAGQTPDGTTIPIHEGSQEIGLEIQGAPSNQDWSFLDWKWITVDGAPFGLDPDSVDAGVDSAVTFTARPHGHYPANPKYVWNFGDDTAPITIFGDSVATHAYHKEGTYFASVELWDPATNQRLARGRTPVLIQDSLTSWRLTVFTGTAPAWTPEAVNTRGSYRLFGEFFERVRQNPTGAVLRYRVVESRPSVSLALVPPPTTGTQSVGLGSLGGGGGGGLEEDYVVWTGSASSGVLQGAHTWSSIFGLPESINIDRMVLDATKMGNRIDGIITVTYKDYRKSKQTVDGKPVTILEPLETKVVIYTFTGTKGT